MENDTNSGAGRLAGLPDVLTPPEIARVLRVGVGTTYELLRRGDLRGKRIGRTWKVLKSSLLDYLDTPKGGDECEAGSSRAARAGS